MAGAAFPGGDSSGLFHLGVRHTNVYIKRAVSHVTFGGDDCLRHRGAFSARRTAPPPCAGLPGHRGTGQARRQPRRGHRVHEFVRGPCPPRLGGPDQAGFLAGRGQTILGGLFPPGGGAAEGGEFHGDPAEAGGFGDHHGPAPLVGRRGPLADPPPRRPGQPPVAGLQGALPVDAGRGARGQREPSAASFNWLPPTPMLTST